MEIMIFDGLENTGKTFMSKLIRNNWMSNKSKRVILKGFPSEKITSSELFSNLLKSKKDENDFSAEYLFIEALIKEEDEFFEEFFSPLNLNHLNNRNTLIIIDRFLFSSLVYQGMKSPELWNFVIKKYDELFEKYNLYTYIKHYIFMTPISKEDRETNDVKRDFDSMNDILSPKFKQAIYEVENNHVDLKGKKIIKFDYSNYLISKYGNTDVSNITHFDRTFITSDIYARICNK